MNIAIIGGTHGNEPVGLEVIKYLIHNPVLSSHSYKCFQGNPEAYKKKSRYVDSDLNRAFGKNGKPSGYEAQRAEELKKEISGFDLSIDLHTTTTNMGLCVILNNTHSLTRKVACYLKSQIPEIHLIEEDILDEECTHLNRLAPAGITIEVGPVANNVVCFELLAKTLKMVQVVLSWDFANSENLLDQEYYQTIKTIYYPEEEGWYIHRSLEQNDFCELKPGDPLFENLDGETKTYKGREKCFPFFINEAAYLESRMAMILARKKNGFK